MSKIYCIVDGMTDENFNVEEYPYLSSMKLVHYVDTTPQGYETESLNCILTLLGVSPFRDIRGYIEAVGAGIGVDDDDLVFRSSWMKLDSNNICIEPGIAPKNLDLGEGIQYYKTGEYKSIIVCNGRAAELPNIVTHPPYAFTGKALAEIMPENPTLRVMVENSITQDMVMIPWGQSCKQSFPPFPTKAAAVCAADIMKGIARILGMDVVSHADWTGDIDTPLKQKAEEALRLANLYPFVLLHINGADEAAHRKNAHQKRDFLKKVDMDIISKLLDSSHSITVASDHATSPNSGCHVGGIQPIYIN